MSRSWDTFQENVNLRALLFIIVIAITGAAIIISTQATSVSDSGTSIDFNNTKINFSKFTFSDPVDSTSALVLNPQTAQEKLVMLKGKKTSFTNPTNDSSEIYTFYNNLLIDQGYIELDVNSSPDADLAWVSVFRKENNIVEVQHYPNEADQYTTQLFIGDIVTD